MIDRPNGKVEELLDRLYQFCGEMWEKAHEEPWKKRIKISTAIASVLIVGTMIVGYVTPETVTVIVDTSLEEHTTVYETTANRVVDFIQEHDMGYVDGEDKLDVDLRARIKNGMTIRITKAIDVTVKADGEKQTLRTLPLTANEAVALAGITVGKDDIVEPAGDTMLKTGDKVVVKRVTYKRVTKKETVPYEVVYKEDASIRIGDMKLTQQGRDGRVKKTYRVKYIDGKEVGRKVIHTETLKKVKNKVYRYGTDIHFGDAPDHYIKKVSHVRAVSYHFDGNPPGAYGLPCTYGTAAVDPKVFPLGSLLYIEGYGYAIANDVGTSIKGNVVDVYMERYAQCLQWGAHYVNVYLVERP